MILSEWREACPDITVEEYRAIRKTVWPEAIPDPIYRRDVARVALSCYRVGVEAGFVSGVDRVHAERAGGEPPTRRGWPACHCGERRLTITCEASGHDRSTELLDRWGYRSDDRPPRDIDGTARALDRAWPGD